MLREISALLRDQGAGKKLCDGIEKTTKEVRCGGNQKNDMKNASNAYWY